MSLTVTTNELRNDWAFYLEQVEKGVELVVTKRGKPVARLIPMGGSFINVPPNDSLVNADAQRRDVDARRLR